VYQSVFVFKKYHIYGGDSAYLYVFNHYLHSSVKTKIVIDI